MIPKNFKSMLQDDCNRLYKKFEKLAKQLNSMDTNLSLEYLESLPPKERNMIIEKAVKLQMEFVPLIQLKDATSKYLEYIATSLEKIYANDTKKEENE